MDAIGKGIHFFYANKNKKTCSDCLFFKIKTNSHKGVMYYEAKRWS